MGSRHLGELLLRPSSLRVSTPQTSSPVWRRTPATCLFQRCLNTSAPAQSAQAQRKPDPEPEPEAEPQSNNESPSSAIDGLFSSRKPRASKNDTSAAIDSIFRSSGIGNNFGSRERSSSDEFGAAAARRQFGSNFSKPNPNLQRKRLEWDNMVMPEPFADMQPQPQAPVIREEDIVYPRLNASTGRTVELDASKGRDIVRGLNMLGSLMARNKVRSDFMKQRYHERGGLKRKRLKSERWRARFKTEFDATCKRVSELTRKGW